MKKVIVKGDRRSTGLRQIVSGFATKGHIFGKPLAQISLIIVAVTVAVSCSDVQRNPGRVYMPDMAYSRAYETYATTEEQKASLLARGIHFSNVPVAGTIKRNELLPFLILKDSAAGDTSNYHASREVRSPLTAMDTVEAERLFLVNCAICHGPKLDGNGPLYRGGDGPFPAKPADFMGGAQYQTMPEGQMYYSVTYGKNKMGSYASQLNTEQRWMVIAYIKSKQAGAHAGAATAAPAATSGAKGGADSTGKK